MKYLSTRGRAPVLGFEDVVLEGLADDGGLYVPADWPRLGPDEFARLANLPYSVIAAHLLALFAHPEIDEGELQELCAEAYAGFDHPEVAPLRALEDGLWVLELFHGPTLAFKDLALQVLGRLFDRVLKRRGERATIVGATSGDTGSAAIEACRDREAIEIFILHPRGRVSEVQRRQMTSVTSANVHNIAVEGTFDDCQALVKAMFADSRFRERYRLSAVNSINWARIAAQVVYYVSAAVKLGAPERAVTFAVPTGNFGNIFAAYVANRIGLPVARLAIGSNRNDILTRFFTDGRMQIGPVFATLSPSMDIQVSSNFERFLFELYDRDGGEVARLMDCFRRDGSFVVDKTRMRRAREIFEAIRVDDDSTTAAIAEVYRETGMLLDPHSAIGVAAARHARLRGDGPTVAVATAHPAKFSEAVERATGKRPELPPKLAHIFEQPERYATLPGDLGRIQSHIARTLSDREVCS